MIAQGINRIVASEWIATNLYIERDLNSMEWRLERNRVQIHVMENFLVKLFTLRRRIGKYAQLVDEQMRLFREDHMPEAWTAHLPVPAKGWLLAVQKDSAQVRDLVGKNAERISKTVDLITSIISVRESQESVDQNGSLKFLTIIATSVLPINAVAAIMALDGDYGPRGGKFWVFFVVSVSLTIFIWVIYGLFRLLKKQPLRKHTMQGDWIR